MNHKVHTMQLTAWLIVAISGPMLSMIGCVGWAGVLTAAVISTVIALLSNRAKLAVPKWLSAIQLVWSAAYLGSVARQSVTCWQIGSDVKVLGVALLVSAAFAAMNGPHRIARGGALLVWFPIPLIAVVLIAGCKNLNVSEIRMSIEPMDWTLLPLFLLPTLSASMSERGGKRTVITTLILGGTGVALSLLMDAALTGEVARQCQNPFYEYAKGATLFGTAKRFETVSACLLTVGWFALFSLLLSIVYKNFEHLSEGSGKTGVWIVTGVAVLVMYNLHIPKVILGKISLICWGLLLILAQGIECVKMFKNSQKSIDKGG